MTEVLEQKIEDLTEYIKNLDIASRADDETYKSILSKISYRLNELDTEENLDIIEIKDRIKFLTSEIEEIDITSNVDKLTRVVDELKEEKEESFTNFNTTITDIKNELTSIRENAQNSSEISNELKQNVIDAISNIENKFNDIQNSQNNAQDEYKDIVINNLNDIKGQLWDTENNIKNAVNTEINDFSNEIDIPNKLEYLIQSISNINKDTTDLVAELENLKYTAQETNDSSAAVRNYLDSTKNDLKNNLRELQEQFVLQLLQVFENISFSAETEEIIDFVDESSYAIKNELETLQKEITTISNKDDSEFFNEHFNNLCDLVTNQTNNEFNLLSQVAQEIKKITANSENSDEYTYSLPDIENDLAKIRLVLKELQTEKQIKNEHDLDISERFELLNEDISSISKRTNKLILTAEETNKKFKSHLDEFKNIMDIFAVRNRQAYIEQKLDSAIRLIVSNAKSTQILNEAFMHFAQWIDETTETIDANKSMLESITVQSLAGVEKASNIQKSLDLLNQTCETTVNQSSTNLDKVSELQKEFDLLNQKFEAKIAENKELQMTIEKQNKLMVKLEQKIESFGQIEAKVDDDTKSVIEYIASQTGIAAENTKDNNQLVSKIEFLEHKIGSLDKNIQKIISYIDEE